MGLQVTFGESGHLCLPEDDALWFIESSIEKAEENGSESISLPDMEQILSQLSDAEAIHFRMFIQSRMGPNGIDLSRSSLIGNTRPALLLIGDVHNPNIPEEWRYRAAFGAYGSTSGTYLMESISEQDWMNWAICNALEEDDLVSVWNHLGRPAIACLGRSADRECSRLGLPHGTVPHPQYVKRFLNKKGREYGALMIEAGTRCLDRGSWKGQTF